MGNFTCLFLIHFQLKAQNAGFVRALWWFRFLLVHLFFFLLKVHRSLINVAQTFACLTVQNNWKQERMFTVCAQNEHIYEAKARDRCLGEGDFCGKIRNMTEGRHLGVPTAGREGCSELSSSGRVKGVLRETHESLLKQPASINKLSVRQSVSSEVDRPGRVAFSTGWCFFQLPSDRREAVVCSDSKPHPPPLPSILVRKPWWWTYLGTTLH